MRINIISASNRVPGWITAGYKEYACRMPPECKLRFIEVAAVSRKTGDLNKIKGIEGKRLLASVAKGSVICTLDQEGQQWSTAQFAMQLKKWLQSGKDIALLIGGADGLSSDCLDNADCCWSLSNLTFPHLLVRVILAEQIYRAWSSLRNHPYHRAGK